MRLSEAAAVTGGALRGADCVFAGVVIDSRRAARGDLFVALRGEQHDGHDFIAPAGAKGAVGALVCREGKGDSEEIAQIRVTDTTAALGRLGAHWRDRFHCPVVAVTGSNGKTTVTALIAAILNRAGKCLAPRASFNNQWGVPLTLLRLRERHTHAVIEMGMNRPGEIAYLSDLAKPGIAVITNAAPAHLAGLGGLQEIADAKAEIFTSLAADGVAVLNADDDFFDHWRRRADAEGAGRTIVSFGFSADADVRADAITATATTNGDRNGEPGTSFILHLNGRRVQVRLPLAGRHNVANALAAAAAASAAGAGLEHIRAGLESATALDRRLRSVAGLGGARVIDDSYNANPASCRAALEVLADCGGERIAVLGAMAELGRRSDELHFEVGTHARSLGIERMLCLGAENDDAIASYLRGFGDDESGEHFKTPDTLLARLTPLLKKGVTVLVKGSRAAAMERVATRLHAPTNAKPETSTSTRGTPSC